MTKDVNIVLTEQILQLVVEIWKIIVHNFRGAAALMIDSAMKGLLNVDLHLLSLSPIVLSGDPDAMDSNISYSQTDPQTARFAESFKVDRSLASRPNLSLLRRFSNALKTNTTD